MKTTLSSYRESARNHNLIPVVKEVLADMETPVSVLGKFALRERVFLLESVEGGETWGRYSFLGVDPEPFLELDHAAAAPDPARPGADQLEGLRTVFRNVRPAAAPGLPRFIGGAVGYLAYEAAREFERLPEPRPHPGIRVRSRFVRADKLVVFDNLRHTAAIVVCSRPDRHPSPEAAYEAAMGAIEEIEWHLAHTPATGAVRVRPPAAFESNLTREAFCGMVRRAKDYIVAGDIIQAVLSQRFTARTDASPLAVYRALRLLNPSPYLFFFKTGGDVVVGSSPEVMVRRTGNRVELRPIAGTRRRGATEQEDRQLADDLLADEKEKAEHVMLVDLGRNDLGRVSETGSVQVRDYMTVERYSHVMHLVSHVEGVLRRDADAVDVLRAAFPAGTLTGAPKVRAMEIIRELEPQPRGLYGGALGYIGYDGTMDMAITIRTLEMTPGQAAVQAGAGIVYNSDPDREYEETCQKAMAMKKALELATGGLALDGDGAAPGGAA
jgi:anthranilate synthase component 1